MSTSKLLFSIVVPVYNVEAYLDRCIKSIINQSYENIEIILVDDGSTDRGPSICDEYAKVDHRILVIHKTNGGLSDARNAGIRAAKGDYLVFIDSDDYVETDYCEKLIKYIKINPDIVQLDAYIESDSSKGEIGRYGVNSSSTKGRMYDGMSFIRESYKAGCFPRNSWLYVVKKDFLLKNNLFFKFGIRHEDEEFTPRMLLVADKVINSGETLYHYVVREGSISKQKDLRKNCEDIYSTCTELHKIYQTVNDDYVRKSLMNSLVDLYLNIFNSGKLYVYKNQYVHKRFVILNSYKRKTILKSLLFIVSPRFYCYVNYCTKRKS